MASSDETCPASLAARLGAQCLICLEAAQSPVRLSCACNITCCTGCLLKWLSDENAAEARSCPTCRRTDIRIIDENNVDLSSKKYEEGRGKIQLATAQQFKNKQLLKDAVSCFVESITADRRNAAPYVGMVYLFMLVADHVSAVRYCDYVLKEFPASKSTELAQALLEKCSPESVIIARAAASQDDADDEPAAVSVKRPA